MSGLKLAAAAARTYRAPKSSRTGLSLRRGVLFPKLSKLLNQEEDALEHTLLAAGAGPKRGVRNAADSLDPSLLMSFITVC